jgi:methyltransferase family protein
VPAPRGGGKLCYVTVLSLLGDIGSRFRRRRMLRLMRQFPIREDWRVLDVGGTMHLWEFCPVKPQLVLLNKRAETYGPPPPGVTLVKGCAEQLPFPDDSFDLVFSNSVIEHVGSEQAMRSFASEVRRVGKRYFIQTPDAAFPIEPHLYTPLLHYLPAGWQRRIAPRYSVWSLLNNFPADERKFYTDHYIDDIRLLHTRELKRLFPESEIVHERFAGLSKSLIAVKSLPPGCE